MLPSELANALASLSADEALMAWRDSKAELAKATAFESALREHNIKIRFTDLKPSGVNNVELGNGYKLKCTTGINYNLANAVKVEEALTKIERALGPDLGADLCRRLVGWTPKLSVSEYKALDPKIKKIIDAVVTTSDKKATLEIVEPAATK